MNEQKEDEHDTNQDNNNNVNTNDSGTIPNVTANFEDDNIIRKSNSNDNNNKDLIEQVNDEDNNNEGKELNNMNNSNVLNNELVEENNNIEEVEENNDDANVNAEVMNEEDNNNNVIFDQRAIMEEEFMRAGRVERPPQALPRNDAYYMPRASFFRLGYTEISLYSALIVLWYTLRTRREFYPAVLYLSSSKLSYIIFGNALAALALSIFQLVCRIFLGGLRSAEREAIRDGMRWSMTETCLALTMFREEVSLNMGGMFLLLTMCKCWHWAIELRGKHLIQTEEAFTIQNSRIRIPYTHMKYMLMVCILSVVDAGAIVYCIWQCVDNGPSVLILFGFESVILAISAFTALNLYGLHFLDGFVNSVAHTWPNLQPFKYFSSVWRDCKLTLNLCLDLVSYSAKFLSYLLFFFIVFTYYGMPFNIFREVYISCLELRKKMVQFASYRKLSHMMDTKFHTCTTEEELEDAGGVCIICRDALLLSEQPKKLPGCGHVFHKYCLKGWLMQQNTCPTCRRDIMAAVKEEARLASVEQLQTQAQQSDDTNNQTNTPASGATDNATTTNNTTTPNSNQTDSSQPSTTNNILEQKKFTVLEENLPPPDPNAPPHSVLPSLYKVINSNGANIIESRTRRTLILRTIPVNKIIICTHLQTWKINDDDVRTMLLMPDGWICDRDVQVIRSIPIPKIQRKGVERDAMDSITHNTVSISS